MDTLYEQMDFILSGGALKLLTDFLASRVDSALIVEPRDADLEVLDAVNVRTESLIMKNRASALAAAFSSRPPSGKFETAHATTEGEWPEVVRIRGTYWTLYLLFRKRPDDSLLAELQPYAGMISLWQTFQHIETTEDRLSRLSYMILATKNTLASIFEPMPLTWYSAFLSDVLRESLFPRAVAIFGDDGKALSHLEGDELPEPDRSGLYAQSMLPPAPVLTRGDTAPYEVVLPLTETDHRLFCVTEWDRLPTEETLNFMELLGSLATRALSISHLRTESSLEKEKVSSGDYTILSLSEALKALKEQKDRSRLLSMAADIFQEATGASESLLVVWDAPAGGYIPAVSRRNGTDESLEDRVIPAPEPVRSDGESLFDLRKTHVSQALKAMGLEEICSCSDTDVAESIKTRNMRYVLPLRDGDRLEGFAAVSSENAPDDDTRVAALRIVAQSVAFELKKFIAPNA